MVGEIPIFVTLLEALQHCLEEFTQQDLLLDRSYLEEEANEHA